MSGRSRQYGRSNATWNNGESSYDFMPKKSNYIYGNEVENEVAILYSKELLAIKSILLSLYNREKYLKSELKNYIKLHDYIVIKNVGIVECQIYRTPKIFKKEEVLKYLTENYGDQIAKNVEENCTKWGDRKSVIYAKLRKPHRKREDSENDYYNDQMENYNDSEEFSQIEDNLVYEKMMRNRNEK